MEGEASAGWHVRVSGHVVAQEGQLVGEVPLGHHAAAPSSHAVQLVAQVPRV